MFDCVEKTVFEKFLKFERTGTAKVGKLAHHQ